MTQYNCSSNPSRHFLCVYSCLCVWVHGNLLADSKKKIRRFKWPKIDKIVLKMNQNKIIVFKPSNQMKFNKFIYFSLSNRQGIPQSVVLSILWLCHSLEPQNLPVPLPQPRDGEDRDRTNLYFFFFFNDPGLCILYIISAYPVSVRNRSRASSNCEQDWKSYFISTLAHKY